MNNRLILDGGLIEISEKQNDPSRKIAKFLLCPLNEGNGNGKGIKESDLTDEELQTLVGQPLVTKLIYNEQTKQYDFSGHLAKKVYKIDENGQLIKFTDFTSTNPIGFHTEVSIEDVGIEGVNKRCIVANVCLWTRYYHAMETIERLGENLHTSWEISYKDSYSEDGTEWLKGILFLANCVLGTQVTPAYKNAGLLEVAEKDECKDELSQALMEDLIEINKNSIDTDEYSVENKQNKNTERSHDEMAEEKKNVEISALTMEDLYTKVRKAIRKSTEEDKWYYISYLYPLDFRAIAHSYDDEETKFVEFTYAVSENGDVSITGKKEVEMIFIPKTNSDAELSTLKTQLSEKETELSQKVDEIVRLGETIQSLNTSIAEKDKEIAEFEPIKQEIAEKKAKEEEEKISKKKTELSEMLVASKYFTQEEIDKSDELQTLISSLDESALKSKIAERVIEQASKVETKTEVSEKDDKVEVSTDLNAESNYVYGKSNNPLFNLINRGKTFIK